MGTVLAICWREFRAYFTSAIGYVVMGAWLAFCGLIFLAVISQPQPLADMQPIFSNGVLVLLFFLPLLTMRLLAGERPDDQGKGAGTIELLLTSPITEWQLVLGKFLAAFLFMVCLVAASLIYVIAFEVLNKDASMDFGKLVGGYVGFLYFGGYLLAFGLFLSSLTNSQIVAAVLGIVGALVLWLISFFPETTSLSKLLNWLSFLPHLDETWSGVLTLQDTFWFLSFIFLFLFATKQVIASSRWR